MACAPPASRPATAPGGQSPRSIASAAPASSRGCVPKKLLVFASRFRGDFEDAAGFGWDLGDARFDWGRLIAAKDREIDRLEGAYCAISNAPAPPSSAPAAVVEDANAVRSRTGPASPPSTSSSPRARGLSFRRRCRASSTAITSNEGVRPSKTLPGAPSWSAAAYIASRVRGHLRRPRWSTPRSSTAASRSCAVFEQGTRRRLGPALVKARRPPASAHRVHGHREDRQRSAPVPHRRHETLEGPVSHPLCTGRVPNTEGSASRRVGVAPRSLGAVKVNALSATSVCPRSTRSATSPTGCNLTTQVAIRERPRLRRPVFGGRVLRRRPRARSPTAVLLHDRTRHRRVDEALGACSPAAVESTAPISANAQQLAGADEACS